MNTGFSVSPIAYPAGITPAVRVPRAIDVSPYEIPTQTAAPASVVPLAASVATNTATRLLGGTARRKYRAINNIVAHVTVEEGHEDDLVITEHPVEWGALITDHAFKKPAEVRLRVGWSESGGVPQQGSQAVSDVATIYAQLLALQQSRNPFNLYTGKRSYKNMLVQSIRVQTNSSMEWTLLADVSLREIILVSTSRQAATSNASAQADPASNKPTENTGEKSTTEKNIPADKVPKEEDDFGGGGELSLGGGSDAPTRMPLRIRAARPAFREAILRLVYPPTKPRYTPRRRYP